MNLTTILQFLKEETNKLNQFFSTKQTKVPFLENSQILKLEIPNALKFQTVNDKKLEFKILVVPKGTLMTEFRNRVYIQR